MHINYVYVHKLCLCAHKLCLCNINIVYVIFVQTAFHNRSDQSPINARMGMVAKVIQFEIDSVRVSGKWLDQCQTSLDRSSKASQTRR